MHLSVRVQVRTMSEEETWEPDENLIEWAKQHFDSIGVGGVWSPDESGCTYVKQDEETFAVMRMVDHPTAYEHHKRFCMLFEAAGKTIIEGDGFVKTAPALTGAENAEERYKEKQLIAQGWRCECSLPIANFNIEEREDIFVEDKEILLSNGDTQSVEVWACKIVCPNCDAEINMDPDDYNLLAGDEIFMTWTDTDGAEFVALTRIQIKDLVDANISGVALGSISPETGAKVPPWMWGTYNLRRMPEAIEKAEEVSDEEE